MRSLLLMSKPARIGSAKTRLARDTGKTEAQRLALMSLACSLRAARGPWNTLISVTPDTAVQAFRHTGFPVIAQGKGDLGERLTRGFAAMPPGAVIVTGTDTPDLRSAHIRHAFRKLQQTDMVIGPAADGGFWLCGLSARSRKRRASPFRKVRWSSQYAMADLIANMPERTRIAFLETLIDLDDARALRNWKTAGRRAAYSSRLTYIGT